jgi:hypothetical protein
VFQARFALSPYAEVTVHHASALPEIQKAMRTLHMGHLRILAAQQKSGHSVTRDDLVFLLSQRETTMNGGRYDGHPITFDKDVVTARYRFGRLVGYTLPMITHNGSFAVIGAVDVRRDGAIVRPLFVQGGVFDEGWQGWRAADVQEAARADRASKRRPEQ